MRICIPVVRLQCQEFVKNFRMILQIQVFQTFVRNWKVICNFPTVRIAWLILRKEKRTECFRPWIESVAADNHCIKVFMYRKTFYRIGWDAARYKVVVALGILFRLKKWKELRKRVQKILFVWSFVFVFLRFEQFIEKVSDIKNFHDFSEVLITLRHVDKISR